MQFNCSVEATHFDEAIAGWRLRLKDGRELTCRFVIMTLGLLSIPTLPLYKGMNAFKGPSFHTFHWPHTSLSMDGKNIAVIGTGATGIQVIAESYERIHRSNLIGMGVLPLEFMPNVNAESLSINGFELFSVEDIKPGDRTANIIISNKDNKSHGFEVTVRIDTPKEWEYFQHGGILQYVIRGLVST